VDQSELNDRQEISRYYGDCCHKEFRTIKVFPVNSSEYVSSYLGTSNRVNDAFVYRQAQRIGQLTVDSIRVAMNGSRFYNNMLNKYF